jgi:hypothetical protein
MKPTPYIFASQADNNFQYFRWYWQNNFLFDGVRGVQSTALWCYFCALPFCSRAACPIDKQTNAHNVCRRINLIYSTRQTSPSAPSLSAKWKASWCSFATRRLTQPTSISRGKSKTKTRPSRRMLKPRVSSASSHSNRGVKISAPMCALPTTRSGCPFPARETSLVSFSSWNFWLKFYIK